MQTQKFAQLHREVNAKKVRILLIERSLRPVDLARRWGVSRAAVSHIIYGKRPNSPLLKKLAQALKVPLSEITTTEEKQNVA